MTLCIRDNESAAACRLNKKSRKEIRRSAKQRD
jgi:hypothetical protein